MILGTVMSSYCEVLEIYNSSRIQLLEFWRIWNCGRITLEEFLLLQNQSWGIFTCPDWFWRFFYSSRMGRGTKTRALCEMTQMTAITNLGPFCTNVRPNWCPNCHGSGGTKWPTTFIQNLSRWTHHRLQYIAQESKSEVSFEWVSWHIHFIYICKFH
jgi:hypothetical protein